MSFHQLAERCANNANEFRREWINMFWIGLFLSMLYTVMTLYALWAAVFYHNPLTLVFSVVLGVVSVWQFREALSCRRKAQKTYEDFNFMIMRQDNLDLAKKWDEIS